MCMKTQGLMRTLRDLREIISHSIESTYRQGRVRVRGKKGLKFATYLREVIENNCRKNGRLSVSGDVDENNRVKSSLWRCL